jgi:GNAT superfamily N-acetyltransferase
VDEIEVRRVTVPTDPALAELSRLMYALFADPDVVLPLERLQAFVAEAPGTTGRIFTVLVAEEAGGLLGGTVFSYVAATGCGFSEYLVLRRDRHGQGIGRLLVDARRARLDDQARQSGHTACKALFIEADNPDRTPAALQARERETAMESRARLRLFAHLGFFRVDMAYVQPPLDAGQQPVTYLDLLCAPWDAHVLHDLQIPARWVYDTVGPIWDNWAPGRQEPHSTRLRERLDDAPLALLPPPGP